MQKVVQGVVVLALFVLILLGILLVVLVRISHSNNTNDAAPLSTTEKPARWTNPCNATRDFSSRNFTLPFLSELEKIQRITEKLLSVRDITNTLQTRIAKERIKTEDMISALQSQHLNRFPKIDISQQDLDEYKDNVTLAYLRSYRDLSVVAIFIEALREDEDKYEYGSWSLELKDVENKLYLLLCELHNAIITNGAVIEYESRDIMPQDLRSMEDRFRRFARDYIIMKDSAKLYQSFLDMYQTFNSSS